MSVSRWLYRCAVTAAAIPGIPYLRIFRPGEVRERLGYLEEAVGGERPGSLWIHAASLGEFEAVRPIVEAWAVERGARSILVSCTNATARRRLKDQLPDGARVRLAPLDLPVAVRRALESERPACILFAETEIWPEWILAAEERGVPMAIVNARLSDRTIPRYRRVRRFLAPVLRAIRVIGCRGEADRARWISIGADPDRCEVWGNTKYRIDRDCVAREPAEGAEPFLLVAGSVRAGEEGILSIATDRIGKGLRLVVAPRHLRALPSWERRCAQLGISFRRSSLCGIESGRPPAALRRLLKADDRTLPRVLLVDRIGMLRDFYASSDAAFVGGTWVPIGGHNLFEAAREGVAVFFGDSTGGVADAAAALLDTGGGARVRDPADLADRVAEMIADPGHAAAMGRAARSAAEALSGGASRSIERLRACGFPPEAD